MVQRYIAALRQNRLLRGPVPWIPPLIMHSEETVSIITLQIRTFLGFAAALSD